MIELCPLHFQIVYFFNREKFTREKLATFGNKTINCSILK